MMMGIVANQNTIHHKNDEANFAMTIILGFPVHGLLMYMLIFGWLKVADILSNPFGNDKLYDINLASTLDLNIWKSSISLENQERAIHSNLLKNPYRVDEPGSDVETVRSNNQNQTTQSHPPFERYTRNEQETNFARPSRKYSHLP